MKVISLGQRLLVSCPSVNPGNKHILQNLMKCLKYLDDNQGVNTEHVLNLYLQVTSNVPRFCTVMLHDGELVSNYIFPLRQPASRGSPRKREVLKNDEDLF